jgi:hypothetical protein
MPRVPFNPKIGRIKTDASNFAVDRSFLAHYHLKPAAEDPDGIAALKLGATVQTIKTGFGDIPEPRNVTVTPSAAAVTGTTVKVYGTDFNGDAIDESFTTGGTSAKVGAKAFASVTQVDLPIQSSTPAKQKATVEVTQGAQDEGTTVFTFVSAATGDAFDVSVDFAATDNEPAEAAAVIAAALNENETFAAAWEADSVEAVISIERKIYAAQDPTINLTVKTSGDSAITLDAIDVDAVSGVAEDVINIGWGKVIGIPYKLVADELVIANLFNNADDNGTVYNSATDLCSNTFAMGGNPDGEKPLDLYIIV